MEYRIEQLARTAGVAVDTIRFYQGKGLLEAPRREGRVTWYGDSHLERLRRIRELQQRGFTLTVIQRFLAGELEPSDEGLVAAVTRPSAPQTLTLAELAQRSGVAEPLLASLEHAGNVDRTARQAVDLFDHHVRERIQAEGGETEAAERKLLALFTELLEASGTLVRHHFERTLLRAAREHIEKRA